MDFIKDKVVMITGGTGSFGKSMAKKLYSMQAGPSKIIVFSRDEYKQSVMRGEIGEAQGPYTMRYFVGDVRDKNRLMRAMSGVDVVLHAAAMKQVDTCEYNPTEACHTNIIGTQNVIECAINNKVEKVLFISTDKAVAPINLYGKTKAVAESLMVSSNVYTKKGTALSVVRYGNVLGSRGSVLEKFREQAEGSGIILITDKRMTRFWWTMGEALNFVIRALTEMMGGEVFVPKLKSSFVRELAIVVCPQCRIREVGARSGEKLHEILMTNHEAVRAYDLGWGYCINPDNNFFEMHRHQGQRVSDDFDYSSSGDALVLSEPAALEWLTEMINKVDGGVIWI